MAPRISIITVVRNAVSTIEETLRSVAAQTYRDAEHIVVDGASTDGTLDIVERYRDSIARLVSEPDRGVYDAMNKGLAVASGEVVGFLNADDFYEHERVLQKVASVMADPQVDTCYADLVYVDTQDTSRVVRYWKSRPYEKGLCQKGWLPAHPTFFARRRVYERFGDFDLAFQRQADFEMALRLFDIHNIKSVYVPEVWVRMRIGGLSNNSMIGVIKGNLEAYRACKKYDLPVTPFFVVRKILSRLPQFIRRSA